MMGEIWKLAVLGFVQGVTEFLPVSSSGHIVICQHLFGMKNPDDDLLITLVLHAGTLVSIIAYYFRDLLRLLTERRWRLIWLIALGTAPVCAVGLVLKAMDWEAKYFGSMGLTMVCYLGTAAILLLLHRRGGPGRGLDELTWRDSLKVGLIQCITPLPGISRSGSTISLATRLGIRQEDAARFSFYIGIVPIAGANIVLAGLKLVSGKGVAGGVSPVALAIGFLLSAGVGYAALVWLIRLLQGGKFHRFGYYCLLLAIGIAIYLVIPHATG